MTRTHLRESGCTSEMGITLENMLTTEVLGWFTNKYNTADGWVIYALDDFEKNLLANEGIDSSDVFRVVVDNRTSLCRIKPSTQTYAFMDNHELYENGTYKFERASAYRSLYIDSKNELFELKKR